MLQTKENDEAMAKLVQPDIVMMDRYFGEIQELDKKINLQASKLAGGGSFLFLACLYKGTGRPIALLSLP